MSKTAKFTATPTLPISSSSAKPPLQVTTQLPISTSKLGTPPHHLSTAKNGLAASISVPPTSSTSPIPPTSFSSPIAPSNYNTLDKESNGKESSMETNQVTFRVNIEASILSDGVQTLDVNKKDKKPGTMQVSYQFHKEQYKSDPQGAPTFFCSSAHKVIVDNDLLQYLLNTPLQVQVTFHSPATTGVPVARSPSSSSHQKKRSSITASTSSAVSLKPSTVLSSPISSVDFIVKVDMSLLLSVPAENHVTHRVGTADGILPFGINELSVQVLTESPILTPVQLKHLNPLTITVMSAKNLPENPFKDYEQMQAECLPVYCTYRFFHEPPVTTPSIPQSKTIKWLHKKTFFTGLYNQQEFAEYLENMPFCVEIHDRDKRTSNKGETSPNHEMVLPHTENGPIFGSDAEQGTVLSVPIPCFELSVAPHLLSVEKTERDYGHAVFMLSDLCLAGSGEGNKHLKFQSEILPSAHVNTLSSHDEKHEYLPFKHGSAHTPGLYVSSAALLTVSFNFTHSLLNSPSDSSGPPFCRTFYIFRNGEHTEILKKVLFTVQDVNSKALKIDVASEMTSATLHSRLKQLSMASTTGIVPDGCGSGDGSGTGSGGSGASASVGSGPVVGGSGGGSARGGSVGGPVVGGSAVGGSVSRPGSGSARGGSGGAESENQADMLDIITGFQVSDQECVILCLEGLADKGMKLLDGRIQRPTPSSSTYKVLSNMDIRFHSRLYAKGGLGLSCIKSIRLSDPLHVILQQKQIYFRKLSTECYQAIHNLHHITKLNKLYEVKAMHLFLNYSMLTALERYFGIPLEEPATNSTTSPSEVPLDPHGPNSMEHKQKTVDIPYIKLNSWALLQKMKQ